MFISGVCVSKLHLEDERGLQPVEVDIIKLLACPLICTYHAYCYDWARIYLIIGSIKGGERGGTHWPISVIMTAINQL